ncbi:MAG TPA: protease inhibitor I42 family protein [Roseiarcus sp.]|nr:protease inhibitor I42 family protein [Roseiarcus sp.]
MAEIVVDGSENGRTINVAVGDSLQIELPENSATGFRWQMEASSLQGVSALRLQSVDYRAANSRRRVFRFSAEGRGHVILRLELVRTWEVQIPRETFVVTANVR